MPSTKAAFGATEAWALLGSRSTQVTTTVVHHAGIHIVKCYASKSRDECLLPVEQRKTSALSEYFAF
jgi:hypothetical protein